VWGSLKQDCDELWDYEDCVDYQRGKDLGSIYQAGHTLEYYLYSYFWCVLHLFSLHVFLWQPRVVRQVSIHMLPASLHVAESLVVIARPKLQVPSSL